MTGNNTALSGLWGRGAFVTQGSASLHPGLRVLRGSATKIQYQFQWWATSLVGAQPYQGKKKGAAHDRSCAGIDGLIFFHDDKSGAKKIVVSVKGGENVSVAMVRDFAHVIER
ncbi:MAG: hypothetical protein ACHQNE_07535, partial [Candidatus Kapaibacterium sp.]